jgi:hypothetical protein
MTRFVASLVCCVLLTESSVVAVEDLVEGSRARIAAQVTNSVAADGPLRRASLAGVQLTESPEKARWAVGVARQNEQTKKGWMERHPVIAGALIGFGAGFAITYAVTGNDDDEFIKIMSPGAAGLFWGGVTAGFGALAGWGISRNRDDDGS